MLKLGEILYMSLKVKKKNRRLKFVILIVTLFSIYLLLSPVLTAICIYTSVKHSNEAELLNYIDLQQLTFNLKQQINDKVKRKINTLQEGENSDIVQLPIFKRLTSSAIHTLSQPSYLLDFLRSNFVNNADTLQFGTSKNVIVNIYRDLILIVDNTSFEYASLNKFDLYVGKNTGKLKITLNRKGLEWKITNITLPF